MSGISNVGNTQRPDLRAALKSGDLTQAQLAEMAQERQARIQKRLGSALESAGVSQEVREAIGEDLAQAFQQHLSQGSFPPERGQFKETLQQVLGKHGLDADEIMGQMRERQGHGRAGASEAPEAASQEQTKILVELLKQFSDDSSNLPDTANLPERFSQYTLDALLGLDEEV